MNGRRPPLFTIPAWVGLWMKRCRIPAFCLVLAAITFVVFHQTKVFDFVNYDDGFYVYHNAKVAGGLSLKGLAWVFSHADCNLYHPLTMLSLMWNYQFHGLDAGGYHSANVLLHTASVILLFLILRQMTGCTWRSAFVAAVFAIHPLRVESVAWVSERKDVLGGFFFMLTLGAYVHFVRKPNSLARYLMVAAAFVMALLSKPTVVTLPFLLLLLDYWPLNRFEQTRSFSRLILEKIPLLVLALGASVMTVLAASKEVAAYADVSLLSRIGNALVSYAVYLRQMIWPVGLAAFYPRPEKGQPDWEVAVSFLVLALITWGVVIFGRKRRWLVTGWFWYLGMLTPMIGIVQAGAFAHADRMTYLPQIGIYVAVTWLVSEWLVNRAAVAGLMVSVLVALMVCSWKQTGYWQDSETLWTHALDCTTDNYMAHCNLGFYFLEEGKLDEAVTNFQTSLQIKPDDLEALNNLGGAFLQTGRLDDAISQYRKVLQIRHDYVPALYNLAVALRQKGHIDEAIPQFQEVVKINPDNADAQYNLASLLFKKGRAEEAEPHYQKVRQIRPSFAEGLFNLGNDLRQKGKVDEAIAQYQDALRVDPDFAPAHVNLGSALLSDRLDEAIFHFQQAVQINPSNAKAEDNLGNAFVQKGEPGEAILHFQKAIQLDPADPWAVNNLAWLLATCPDPAFRDGSRAVELARQASGLAGEDNPIVLHTLAAALAESGKFSEAVETAQHALSLAGAQSNTNLVGQIELELKLYKSGRPFHSPRPNH